MKYLLSIVLLALIGFTTPKKTIPAYDWGSVSAEPDLSWADQVGAQRTPENTEWDAGKFGLRNDTSVFSTPAIQAAIDACHQQGGGTVVVAPGYYKIGALFIKSGVNLHLSKGTTLLASDNIQDYPEFPSRIAGIEMTWPSAVINIMDAENAALTGEGFIDCRGKVFWDKYWAMREEYEKKNLRWIVDYDCKRGVAQVARKLGKVDDYEYFSKRALAYQKYWDKDTRFFRGKNQDGSWLTPFNPVHSTHRNDAYCEGNGWQYTWLIPHDVEGLISLLGGDDAFVSKLDSLFSVNADLGDAASPDISGLIGQYAHGNEPGHHTVYLYSYAGLQWKTAEKVDYILSQMYHDSPDGLQGNEDCGQMSSWYVFSSLGFYPVNPSNGIYVFGRPIFDKVALKLPENKVFEIKTVNNSRENKYIQSVQLNGRPYDKSYISHADIVNGGTLVITMGNKPNKDFGANMDCRPKSAIK